MNIEEKRKHEKEIMRKMIGIYCRGKHKTKDKSLCDECQKLYEYAAFRTEKCPFMAEKSFCSACKIHCYSRDMKLKVKEVMRYSGPRMIFCNPGLCIKHLIISKKQKKSVHVVDKDKHK